MTSQFITTIETDLGDVEAAVVAGAKAALNYVENVATTDIEPALVSAWKLVERNGGTLLLAAATNVLPSLVAGQWATAVANLIADAKAAGAQTVADEETLAGSTALQIVQAAQATVAAVVAPVAATPAT